MPLRDSFDHISPPWHLGPVAKKLRSAIMYALDGQVVIATEGVKARMPELAPEDALPIIGRDRRIVRGFLEGSASYRARLIRWLDDWRKAGSPYAIMGQVRGYTVPSTPRTRIVQTNGTVANWYTIETDGSTEWHRANVTNWDWDGGTDWSRFWVIIYSVSGPWVPEGDWGGAGEVWGDTSGTWGTSAMIEEVQSTQRIVADWKPATATCTNIIIAFDSSKLSPTASPGSPMPDGTWGKQYKISGGNAVPSRDTQLRYWNGA